uniref:RING-type domain-containing protein n=1 Tax=Globodera rostochiensis TaxID=31243 RepID=A0A914IE26_GLORO
MVLFGDRPRAHFLAGFTWRRLRADWARTLSAAGPRVFLRTLWGTVTLLHSDWLVVLPMNVQRHHHTRTDTPGAFFYIDERHSGSNVLWGAKREKRKMNSTGGIPIGTAGADDLEMNIVLATTHTASFVVEISCPDGACRHGSFELKKDLEAEQNFSLELGHLVPAEKRIVEIKIEIKSITTLGARLRSYEWNIATFDSTKFYVFYLGEFKPNNSEDIRLFLRGILTKSVLPELEEHYMYRMTLRKWTTITSSSSRKPIAQIFVSNQKRLEWSSNGFVLKLNSDGVDYIRKQSRPSMLLEIRKMELDECSVCLELLDKNGDLPRRLNNCKHFFHNECISQWSQTQNAGSNTCPICRGKLVVRSTAGSIFGGRSFWAYVFNRWWRNGAGAAALPMISPAGTNATTGTALPSPAASNRPRRRHRRQQNATHIFQKPRSKRLFTFKILEPVLQNGHGGPRFTYDLWLSQPKTSKMGSEHIHNQTMKVVDTRQKVNALFKDRDIVSTDSQESVNQQTEPAAVASTNDTIGSSSSSDSDDDEESDNDTQPDEQVQVAASESFDESAAAAAHNASPSRPSAAAEGEEMNSQRDCMSDRELDAMYKYMQNGDVIVLHGLSPTKRAMIIKFVNDVVKPAEKQMHYDDNDETDEQILLKYLKSGDLKAFKRLKGSSLKKQIEQMMLELGPEDLRDKIAEAIAISRSMVENYSPNQQRKKTSTNNTSGISINEPPQRRSSYGYGASDSNRARGKNKINTETDQEESTDYVTNENRRNLGRTTQKGGPLGECSNNYADQQNSEYDEAPIESYEEWKRKKEQRERQTPIRRNENEHLGLHEQNKKNLSRRTPTKLDKHSDSETQKQSDKDNNNDDHLTETNFARPPQMERQFRKNPKKIAKSGEANESSPSNSEFGDFLRQQNSDQLAERRKRNQVDIMQRNMGNNEMEPYMTTKVPNQCHRRPMIQVMMSILFRSEGLQTDQNRREATKAEKVTILIRIDECAELKMKRWKNTFFLDKIQHFVCFLKHFVTVISSLHFVTTKFKL